jgi:hypothetical protein
MSSRYTFMGMGDGHFRNTESGGGEERDEKCRFAPSVKISRERLVYSVA